MDDPLQPKERGDLSDEMETLGNTAKIPHVAIPMAGVWPSGFDPTTLEDENNGNNRQVNFCMDRLLFGLSTKFPVSRYGRIPQRVPKRHWTKKRYELFQGNLVIDNEVPSRFLDMCPLRTGREFKFMRWIFLSLLGISSIVPECGAHIFFLSEVHRCDLRPRRLQVREVHTSPSPIRTS
jgi:Chitin synthase N-terminal